SPGWNASKLADLPVLHSVVSVTVVSLREAARRFRLVLVVILLDHRHQGFCVAVLEHDLPCFSALQRFARELLCWWKPMSNRHLIEVVEEIECSFLIFRRELMRVVAFGQRNTVSMGETFVQPSHFANAFTRAFNGEKIEYRGSHQYRPRIHQQQEPGM